MYGFKKGAKPKQRFADGGRVRGPGTGTSDDIDTEVPAGSYIMPADSTEQIGEAALQGMGAPVPVSLSNGEYQMPPEQVHAVGVQALDAVKNATHVPVAQQAKGFSPRKRGENGAEKPELFFADGGVVDEERKKQTRFDITNTPAAQRAAGAVPEASAPVATSGYSADPTMAKAQANIDAERQAMAVHRQRTADAANLQPGVAPGYSDNLYTANAQARSDAARQQQAVAQAGQLPDAPSAQGFSPSRQGNDPARAARMQAQFDQQVTGPDRSKAAGFTPQYRTEGPGWRTDSVLRGTGDDVAQQWASGEYARGFGTGVRGALAAVPAAFADAGEDVGRLAEPVVNFGKGLFGWDDTPPALRGQQAAQGAAAPSSGGAPERGQVLPAAGTPTGALESAANTGAAMPSAGSPDIPNNITRVGNSFSGTTIRPGYTVNGQAQAAGFPPSGQRSAQNERAVENLLARTPDVGRGFSPNSVPQMPPMTSEALAQYNAGNSGAPRVTVVPDSSRADSVRQAALNAASTPYRGSPNGQLTARQIDNLFRLQQSDDRNATSLASTRANNDTALAREQVQQQGANQRAALQEMGQGARFLASNELDRQRLAGEQEARGFQTRAAQRIEKLYEQYDKAAPEDRAAIAEQIRVLAGKDAPNRFTVVPGGQEYDPQSMQLLTRPARVLNNQTGQFIDQQTQSAQPVAPRTGEVRSGYRFKGGNPADQNNWEKV
ncbi:hypothetical protein I8S27_26100 [Pseudomonas aeruginosa]|uniref:hypothetical protein n=1 Tax=Pseudomonas aeruginosa TaxID=287 RepID=UPI000BB76A5E|nr:hypothetical protein [Pseudomonas aeruginosa]MBH8257666.1 hypothetical protein [Pseudomonas aeruginosa]PBW48988.1 hypothetical protein CJU09_14970 [Pseudomonas aeruginosa]HCF3551025.1 hypothetical protein [Pseudomonas aeruginosa]